MPIFGGTWDASAPPVRSGLFFNVVQDDAPAASVPASGTVALIAQANWGPHNAVTTITTLAQAQRLFGTTGTLATAVGLALDGSGSFGAAAVKVYRIVGDSPAKATAILTKSPSGTGITLTATHFGTRANGFTATVREDPANASNQQIVIYEGATILEIHTYATTDSLASIVAQVNGDSSYVVASTSTTGTLAAASGITFSSGTNGSALSSGNYDTALTAFEAIGGQFSVFCVDDYNGLASGVKTAVATWVNRLNDEGSMFVAVVGGAATESVSTAVSRSASIDSEWIVNVTRDLEIAGTTYSASTLCPLVAGAIAGVGTSRAISLLQVDGATVINPPTVTETETLVSGGVVPFIASDASVTRLQRGRTTLTTLTSTRGDVFQSILQVRKIHETLRQLTDVYIGIVGDGLPNNASGRGQIMGAFKAQLETLAAQGVVNPDWTVELDGTQDNTGETLYINLVARPAPTVEVVLGTWVVPTA